MLRKLALLTLLFAAAARAEEVFDNGAVIRLVQAGLGVDVVQLKIEQSATHFDVSTQGLIELKADECRWETPLAGFAAIFGATSYRSERQEWWFADASGVRKFRGKASEINAITELIAHRNPSARHGSCGGCAIRSLFESRR